MVMAGQGCEGVGAFFLQATKKPEGVLMRDLADGFVESCQPRRATIEKKLTVAR